MLPRISWWPTQVCTGATYPRRLSICPTEVDGNALPFEGAYVNYKRTGLTASSFQQIEAGQTVTVPVYAAKTYKLGGVSQAKVTAIQGFHYVEGTETPSSLKDLAACEDVTSGEVEVTPDQATVAEYVPYTGTSPSLHHSAQATTMTRWVVFFTR